MKRFYWLAVAVITGTILGGSSVGLYQRHVFQVKSAAAEHYYVKLVDGLNRSRVTLEILKDLDILTEIRRGKTNSLIEVTEHELALAIDRLCRETAKEEILTNSNDVHILRKAAQYWVDHSLKSDNPDIDKLMQDLLPKSKQ